MEWFQENWLVLLPAIIAGLEVFLGALPNNFVPYRSLILRILKAIDEK